MNDDLTNDLIAVIWPALDKGMSKSEVMDHVHNVLDSWVPMPASMEPDDER